MSFLQFALAQLSWNWIKPFDVWLLTHINQQWSNSFFDSLFMFSRETLFWMPLYLFLFVFILLNFKTKGLWWVIAVIVVAGLSDLISSQFLKNTIFRLRPCQDPSVAGMLRFFINYCPISSSFTSSHATTHFAQATFFYLTLRQTSRWWMLAFLWAFLIAYGQIYVGVHYPFDVLCGSILGCGIGWGVAWIFKKQTGMLSLD